MNSLKTQTRKLIYLVGILVLLVPITTLGLPRDGSRGTPGGVLAELRRQYDLGESNLGDVDPSSAAMNLVLLGMRGVAVNFLYNDLDKLKDQKRWVEMRETTESIVRLQPHFEKVWEMAWHNLTYNTSAEWDAVSDRYFWVKTGGKFLMRGVERNRKSTDLQYHVGVTYQKKIGTADESKFYRDYFLHDPDPKFKGSVDPEFNPQMLDNYLVAKKEYRKACDIEDTEHRRQHVQDRSLFRASPARCQFDYAQALQKDGTFGEVTREAWQEALSDWTKKFGQEILRVPVGPLHSPVMFDIRLEMTLEDVKREVPEPDDVIQVAHAVESYRKMCNYYYWRTRGKCEADPTTSEAHRSLFEANQHYKKQELEKAREAAMEGLKGFEDILNRPEYADLRAEELLVEECLVGLLVWEEIHRLSGETIPASYPLKWLEVEFKDHANLMRNVQKSFKRLFLDDR